MKRPLRTRIWFYKPWFGYLNTGDAFFLPKGWWKPWDFGGDEFNWHTFVLGNPVTGRVIFATRECTGTGKCSEECLEFPELFDAHWPVDTYGHNHIKCDNEKCHCKDDDYELD